MKKPFLLTLSAGLMIAAGCSTTQPKCPGNSCAATPAPIEPVNSCSSANKSKPYVTPKDQPEIYRMRRPSGKRLPGMHNLEEAVNKAKAENKFVLVQYGRELCSNCQKVWDVFACKDVVLPDNMIYADVDCDDPATIEFFSMNFTIDDDAFWLPYIVVVAPDGSQLASCSGLKTPDFYTTMIADAVTLWNETEKQD